MKLIVVAIAALLASGWACGEVTDAALQAYLDAKFPAAVAKVSVNEKLVRIEGTIPRGANDVFLADIPMDLVLGDPACWQNLQQIQAGADGRFMVDIPRVRDRNGHAYDRLTSRWQIVSKNGELIVPASQARYAGWVAKHNVMVSVILLIGNPAKTADPVVKLLGHPDATKEGIFSMPNVTSEEGISLYGAALNFLAERWSRPDGKYGRVHHWIMHNEVDAGWEWTNAGDKPAIVYMDLYQRSMRLMNLIASQHDPNARAFISLTHFWTDRGGPHFYGSKQLIDLLVRFSQTEGDFPWAVAFHPYPQNLTVPRTWEDDQATFDLNTKQITPKNLEVLDAYMKQSSTASRSADGMLVPEGHRKSDIMNSPLGL